MFIRNSVFLFLSLKKIDDLIRSLSYLDIRKLTAAQKDKYYVTYFQKV